MTKYSGEVHESFILAHGVLFFQLKRWLVWRWRALRWVIIGLCHMSSPPWRWLSLYPGVLDVYRHYPQPLQKRGFYFLSIYAGWLLKGTLVVLSMCTGTSSGTRSFSSAIRTWATDPPTPSPSPCRLRYCRPNAQYCIWDLISVNQLHSVLCGPGSWFVGVLRTVSKNWKHHKSWKIQEEKYLHINLCILHRWWCYLA